MTTPPASTAAAGWASIGASCCRFPILFWARSRSSPLWRTGTTSWAPLIYLNEPKKQTLAIAIRTWEALRLQAGAKPAAWNHIMAVSVLMTLPPMMVFFFAQRHFIQGVVLSGIKG